MQESSPKEMYTAVELHTMPTHSERKDSKDSGLVWEVTSR